MPDSYQLLKGCCISCSGIDNVEKVGLYFQRPAPVGFLDECEREAKRPRSRLRRKFQILDASDVNGDDDDDVCNGSAGDAHSEAVNRTKEIVQGITHRNRIPPFSGCRVCTTGFSVEVRDEIKHFVVNLETSCKGSRILAKAGISDSDNDGGKSGKGASRFLSGGGTYHGELTPECTHLIASSAAGQKYKFARQWEMHVVSLEWFIECLRTGIRQKESDFPVPLESTPMRPAASEQPLDFAEIPESSLVLPQQSMRSRLQKGISKQGSAASASTDIPQTRASEANRNAICLDDFFMGSRAISRNNTANGSVSSEILDLPLGLDYSARADIEEEDEAEMKKAGGHVSAQRILRASSAAIHGKEIRERSSSLAGQRRKSMSEEMSMLLDNCHIALSRASIEAGRRRELGLRIAKTGGLFVEDGAVDRYLSYAATRIPQAAADSFSCTHYIVGDSDQLCEEDRRVLVEWGRAAHLQAHDMAFSLSDAGRRGRSLSASSVSLSSNLPAIVKSSWLHDCWGAQQRVDEREYRLNWPAASNTLSRAVSADSMAEESLRPGESIDMSSDGRSVAGIRNEQVSEANALPPHPQHLVGQRSSVAQGVKRQHLAGSLAGRPLLDTGRSRAIDVDSDSEAEDALPRKRPATSARGRASAALPIDISSSPSPESKAPLRHGMDRDNGGGSESAMVLSNAPEPAATSNNGRMEDRNEPSRAQIFRECIFASIGLTDSAGQTLRSVVVENGGEFVDLFAQLSLESNYEQLRKQCGSNLVSTLYQALSYVANMANGRSHSGIYIVIQLSGIEEAPLCEAMAAAYPRMHIVTECWVETCLYDGRLYPSYEEVASRPDGVPGLSRGQHILFRPLWRNQVADAEKLSLSISGYEGIERDHIGKLAMALKIPFSERFSRKTTHLICSKPFKGPKYERAVKWHTPVVDSSWLYDIAVASRAESDAASADVCFGNLQPELLSTTPATTKAARERVFDRSVSVRNARTPLNRLTRGMNKDTPGRTPMDISLDKSMQQALGNNNNKSSVALGHAQLGPGICSYGEDATQMSPTRGAYVANLGSDLMGGMPGSEPSEPVGTDGADGAADGGRKILDGVVVALTTRLYHMRHDLAKLALEMGCRFLPRFDASQVTHLVHQSHRKKETAKDYRVAIENGIEVVSPWWLFACRDAMQRVPESEFPYTFHPERRLKLVSASPAKSLRTPNAAHGTASMFLGAKESSVTGSPMQQRAHAVQTLDATGDLQLSRGSVAGSAERLDLKRAAD
ncbi:protein kinase activating protein dpb11, partial [Coemansia sp. RSA 2598]